MGHDISQVLDNDKDPPPQAPSVLHHTAASAGKARRRAGRAHHPSRADHENHIAHPTQQPCLCCNILRVESWAGAGKDPLQIAPPHSWSRTMGPNPIECLWGFRHPTWHATCWHQRSPVSAERWDRAYATHADLPHSEERQEPSPDQALPVTRHTAATCQVLQHSTGTGRSMLPMQMSSPTKKDKLDPQDPPVLPHTGASAQRPQPSAESAPPAGAGPPA